jgi:DNA-binding transcriptional LysR family regulator
MQPSPFVIVIRFTERPSERSVRVNLDRLQTFRVLAQLLHFRRAAEKLNLSQSAVSQQIAALEREVGAPLFERIGRRVYLTPAGKVLAEEAVKVISALERAREAVASLGKGDAGRLRIGASTTPGVYLVPEVLGQFRTQMPLVELELRIGNSSAIEAALVANEVDLGVLGGHVTHGELFEVALGPDRIVAVASPALVGKTRRIGAADLARWPLLCRETGSATRQAVEESLEKQGVRLRPAFELPSPEALLRAAMAGLGATFVSRRAAAPEIKAKRLVELEVEGVRIERPLHAAHHRDKRVTPAMREMIALLRNRLVGR